MPKRSSKLLYERNEQIRARYQELKTKYPEWKYHAILEKISKEFYLSPAYIQKIVIGQVKVQSNQIDMFNNLK